MNLGNTIKEIRKRKSISQGELSLGSGITQAYLSQIENNKKEPNLSVLKEICSYLETPMPVLFYMAITESDIPEEKQDKFKLLSPHIDNLIKSVFFTDAEI